MLQFPQHGLRIAALGVSLTDRIGAGYSADVEATARGVPPPDQILGQPVTVIIEAPGGERAVNGIVTRVEHRAPTGDDQTLLVTVGPLLAPLAHRADLRIFEHRSTLQIAAEILADWGLEPLVRCNQSAHPPHEYRVQYAETQGDFLRRILEEEGISLLLEPSADGPERVVFDDAPHLREPVLALAHAARLADADGPAYADLATLHALAPSALSLRDHDFSLRADVALLAETTTDAPHPPISTYALELGAFFVDGARSSDARSSDPARAAAPLTGGDAQLSPGARSDAQRGQKVTERRLAALRADASRFQFHTNVATLHAGAVVRLRDLAHPLLVTAVHLDVGQDRGATARIEAVDARIPYVPPRAIARPVVRGVQTARVVGPAGQEVHVDAHGRVRVEMLWDRRPAGERSTCWVRVAHGWAGTGFGLVAIPRVGQGVLVGFLDGDPDRPVIVGRLFDGSSPHPYPLPQNATKTGLRTSTLPGGEGFNELSFEDARGRELVYLRAERDRETLVRADDRLRVDGSRDKAVLANETIAVSGTRSARIGGADVTEVGDRFTAVMAGGKTSIDMTEGHIRLTTGAASLALDGPDARLVAEGHVEVTAQSISVRGTTTIRIEAGAEVHVETSSGDVVIQGGPFVRINPADADPADADVDVDHLPVPVPGDVDLVASLDDAADAAAFDPERPAGIGDLLAPGGAWDFLSRGEAWRAFHFFHAGAVSRAAGQPLGVALRQEGRRYETRVGKDPERGDPGNGLWGGKAPYGLEPADAEALEQGAAWYGKTLGAAS
ncbi:VgrG protein [Chondromyces apiculatus DSM 436]|uniref:VgrG protein n=1 Tax=Chondromyces apiculatus DSM 436 TaxID=1192034 RepID=A0A017STU1_9BACT|nr:VgrG protein [Chondromyces apiculatus DSM 436]